MNDSPNLLRIAAVVLLFRRSNVHANSLASTSPSCNHSPAGFAYLVA